jgi:hypothetical protein
MSTSDSYADPAFYLRPVIEILKTHWPENRAVNILCHGHSVPAGYFATPRVDSLNTYPYLLRVALAERFERHVLTHRPDVVTIDYGLNDRRLGLATARKAWESMIAAARGADACVRC